MDLTSLREDLQELVKRQLDSGRYESVDDLLCEALRIYSEQELYFESHRAQFRDRIARGVEQAERGELRDGEVAMADVRRRMLDRRAGSA